MKIAVIFNGLAGSGKDYVGTRFAEREGGVHLEYKTQLYKDTANYYGINLAGFIKRAKDDDLKDKVCTLSGETPRDMLIHVSEDIMKPLLGGDRYGRVIAREIKRNNNSLFVITDGGFRQELEPVSEAADYVLVVRLKSNTYRNVKDSRSLLDLDDYPYTNTHLFEWFNNKESKDSADNLCLWLRRIIIDITGITEPI